LAPDAGEHGVLGARHYLIVERGMTGAGRVDAEHECRERFAVPRWIVSADRTEMSPISEAPAWLHPRRAIKISEIRTIFRHARLRDAPE
jgi:hypothetical protein